MNSLFNQGTFCGEKKHIETIPHPTYFVNKAEKFTKRFTWMGTQELDGQTLGIAS